MKLKPIKVSALNQFIKKYLMSNAILNNLRVEGEITNLRKSKTGYTYFTLNDESSSINCVCFFDENISKDGDKIIVEGELSVYEVKGSYQINVRNIERLGMGKILSDLQILIDKLKLEGMFEKNNKIPLYPGKIGIITSKTGAAIKDILKTFESVHADFEIIVYNVLVQGEKSKQNIMDGIHYFNENKADVILISRGGGSFEDLNIFNDIKLAEEIYKSKVAIITGIGHEIDRTLADLVADEFCHTPTAAAERIIYGYRDIEIKLNNLKNSLNSETRNYLNYKASELKANKYILKSNLPLEKIYKLKHKIENYKFIMKEQSNKKLNEYNFQLELLNEKLKSNNYNINLSKGFSIVKDENGKVINHISQIKEKDILEILFKDFKVKAQTLYIKRSIDDGKYGK
ncbi:MAG: xseA [Bacillota bacterium]|jgi:exodeoxyribonuclease VII large subunit|nr:xseA [Bacillota bacterium]